MSATLASPVPLADFGDFIYSRGSVLSPAAKDLAAKSVQQDVISPLLMPVEQVSNRGRKDLISALVSALPGVAKASESTTKTKIEAKLRALHDGTEDPNKLLPPLARGLTRVRILLGEGVGSSKSPIIGRFEINLSEVSRGVPHRVENGQVTQLAVECSLEIVAEMKQRMQIVATPLLGCLPEVIVEPASFRLHGRLKVWWDTGSGVLKASFLRKPSVHISLQTALGGCAICSISSRLRVIVEDKLRKLDLRHPFTVPFKAPAALRYANIPISDDSLAHMRGQVKQATRVLRSLAEGEPCRPPPPASSRHPSARALRPAARHPPPLNPSRLTTHTPPPPRAPPSRFPFHPCCPDVDNSIPDIVLRQAKGLVLMTQLKGGLGFSYSIGSGVLISRLPSGGWSGPCSISTAGIGLGIQAGVRKTDAVIVLFNEEAINAFTGQHQVKLGADLAIAVGPVGRELSADARFGRQGFATSLAYSHSQGVYGGYSFAGEILSSRSYDNEEYYGIRGVSVRQILDGSVPPPADADAEQLYALLQKVAVP